jgi:hypothetical protein
MSFFSPMCAPTWNALTAVFFNQAAVNPASSSLATSSSTLLTFPPPVHFGGSDTFNVLSSGVRCTPESPTVSFSFGFLMAFTMLGSEIYRGSANIVDKYQRERRRKEFTIETKSLSRKSPHSARQKRSQQATNKISLM